MLINLLRENCAFHKDFTSTFDVSQVLHNQICMKSAPSNPVNFSPDMPADSAMYLLSVFTCFPAAFKVV